MMLRGIKEQWQGTYIKCIFEYWKQSSFWLKVRLFCSAFFVKPIFVFLEIPENEVNWRNNRVCTSIYKIHCFIYTYGHFRFISLSKMISNTDLIGRLVVAFFHHIWRPIERYIEFHQSPYNLPQTSIPFLHPAVHLVFNLRIQNSF